MNAILRNLGISFRIGGAMVSALCGIEALGLIFFSSSPLPYPDLGLALLVGGGVAFLNALGIGLLTALLRLNEETSARFTSLGGALGLLYLILALWIKAYAFPAGPGWMTLLAFATLFGIVIGLGRFLYLYFNHGAPDLAQAKFQALGPVAVMSAGLYSTAHRSIYANNQLALAVLGIIVFLVFGQYLITRVIWARKHEPFSRWGVRFHYFLLGLLSVWAGIGVAAERSRMNRPATASPNLPPVILISIDTLRADFLSANNPKAAATPNFDALAKDGVNFSHAMSASCWTPTGVAGFLTGLDPAANGSGTLIPLGKAYNFTGPLASSPALARDFADQGVVTAAVVTNHWLSVSHEFARGFRYYELIGDAALNPQFLITQGFELIQNRFRSRSDAPGAKVTARTKNWLRRRPAGPFFLWVHYLDPHLPYLLHPQYPPRTKPGPMTMAVAENSSSMQVRYGLFNLAAVDHQYLRERYEGEVRYMDDELGLLLAEVKALGLYEPSIIAVVADHGEEFWEHGNFEHGQGFYNELIHVPLIIKLPGHRDAGKVVPAFVSTTRVGATLLSAAGLKSNFPGPGLFSGGLPGSTLDGFWLSQAPLADGEKGAVGDSTGHKALIHKDDSITCYDLNLDPGEALPFPEAACPWPPAQPSPRELFRLFNEQNQRAFRSLGGDRAVRRSSSPEEIRRLKALGYVQ